MADMSELLRACPDCPLCGPLELAVHGYGDMSPHSDLGDPSLLDARLAWESPHALFRKRMSAERDMSSPRSAIIAS